MSLRTDSATAGTPTASSPRLWPQPATGWPTSTSGAAATPAWGGAATAAPTSRATLLAVVRHLGGPAVLLGHSISGGAATIAAATAPDLVAGVIELAPFTRRQPVDLELLRVRRYRTAYLRLARVMLTGNLTAWMSYLDLAIPVKPADWGTQLARIVEKLAEPGRTKVLRAMIRSDPGDAGAQLPHVNCPVLIVEGSADPDWADPRTEGERILADLRPGLGELAVLDGVGHYPHVQAPDQVLALALPFWPEPLRPRRLAHFGRRVTVR